MSQVIQSASQKVFDSTHVELIAYISPNLFPSGLSTRIRFSDSVGGDVEIWRDYIIQRKDENDDKNCPLCVTLYQKTMTRICL
jgi:hypothetical protein